MFIVKKSLGSYRLHARLNEVNTGKMRKITNENIMKRYRAWTEISERNKVRSYFYTYKIIITKE